jgi:ubiquinone/menaquinone biosynthesis C-methylase UbiE
MAPYVCPWWMGYFLANPLRRFFQNPVAILEPFVKEGMVVLEPGPGMGFFTLDLARMVGPAGRVVAVDLQEKMLASLRRRAQRAGLLDRLEIRLAAPNVLGITDLANKVDFVLAFAMVHEMPVVDVFFKQVSLVLKPGGTLLLCEPRNHVTELQFLEELEAAAMAGLKLSSRPDIRQSWTAVLKKIA